jgi:Leucine-rich repeat (LRR) protein
MKGITVKILRYILVAAVLVFMPISMRAQQAQPKAQRKAGGQAQAEPSKPPAEPVQFPDKNLEAAVRQQVIGKKDPSQPLTKDDVRYVATIEAKGKGIRDLTGLENCVSLTSLDLSGNEIADLTPLEKLKSVEKPDTLEVGSQIKWVDLSKNKITSLKGLDALGKLEYAQLSDNQITDLTPLGSLTRLNDLYLSNNQIKDLTPLANLKKLWTLYADGNQITDLKPVAGLTQLTSLDLKGNQITDISPLAALTSLRYLALDGNKIRTLAPLVSSAKKDFAGDKSFAPYLKLYVARNPLTSAAKTAQLAELKSYGVTVIDGGMTPSAAPKTGTRPGASGPRPKAVAKSSALSKTSASAKALK